MLGSEVDYIRIVTHAFINRHTKTIYTYKNSVASTTYSGTLKMYSVQYTILSLEEN